MIPGYARPAGCNRETQWLRGDSNARKLLTSALIAVMDMAHRRTQWLLLQDQEDRIQKLKVFRQVVELYRVSLRSSGIDVASRRQHT